MWCSEIRRNSAKQTESLGIVDEVHVHLERVGRNEDVRAELAVELLYHLYELRVENACGPLQLRHALPVPASHGELSRDTSQWASSRHHYSASSKLV